MWEVNFFTYNDRSQQKRKNEIVFKGQKLSKKERIKNSALVMQDVSHQLSTDSVEEELKLDIKELSQEK